MTPASLALIAIYLVVLLPLVKPLGTYQAPRVARARGLQPEAVRALVGAHAQGRWLGILGEPRVNVLELNLALEGLK